MTVKQLKATLDKYPEDAIVYVYDFIAYSASVLQLSGISEYKEKNEYGEKSVYLYSGDKYKKKET
uniref:Uncharacterized protein n=1 Tax=viral metagenome TaxID=1070528 RepID=A0A6M3JFV7_9ZZZZ